MDQPTSLPTVEKGTKRRWACGFLFVFLLWNVHCVQVAAQTFDDRKNEILDWATNQGNPGNPNAKFDFWYAQANYARGNISRGNELAEAALTALTGNDPSFQLWGAMDCYLRWNNHMSQGLKDKFKNELTGSTEWNDHNTSNKQLMAASGRYLAQQTWPGSTFGSGYSGSDPTGETFLNNITDQYVHRGEREHNASTYFVLHYESLRSVADFATGAMQNRAALTAEWMLASAAPEWLAGHWAASMERSNEPYVEQNVYRGAIMQLWLHFGGPSPASFVQWRDHAFSVQGCVSSFRVIDIIKDIANDRSGSYTHKELHFGWNTMRFYPVTYMTPDWALHSQHEGWSGSDWKWNHQFHRWAVRWKKASGKSTFFIKNPHDNSEKGATEWEQVLQHKGTLVGVYKLGSASNKHVKGWIPTNYNAVINNASSTGRVYLDYGNVMIAFHLTQTFSWSSSSENFQKNTSSDVGLVVEVVSGSAYADLNAFKQAVDPKFNAVSLSSGPGITYTALDGTLLESKYRDFDKINGATVSYTEADWPLLNNPWMDQDYDGDILTINKDGQTRTYNFANWTVSGGGGGGNTAPAVNITSPANGTTFTEGVNITINANASDTDGSVTRVEFYQGSTKLGEDTSSPYSYSWNNISAGSYSLTAKATDNDGAVTTSSAISVTVNSTSNNPPTVSITSPNAGATFTEGDMITINASASDSDGSISKVEFLQGATKLGEDTSAPYSYNWNNASAGSYNLTARATDNNGAVTTSTVVDITVNSSSGGTSPVLHWMLDETSGTTASDASGNGNNGSLLNGLGFSANNVPGHSGNALDFDGSNDVIRLGNSVVNGYPFSLSAWVKFTGTNKMALVYLGKGSSWNQYFTIGVNSGKAMIAARNTSSYELSGSTNINDNQWHRIVGVFENSSSRKLYVDGTLEGTATTSVSYISGTDRFSAGALDRSSMADRYSGVLDDVALYDVALDQSQSGTGTSVRRGDHSILNNMSGSLMNVSVYPNPASYRLNISMYTSQRTAVRLSMIDMVGKVVMAEDYPNVAGYFHTEKDIAEAGKGLYMLILKTVEGEYRQKVIVE